MFSLRMHVKNKNSLQILELAEILESMHLGGYYPSEMMEFLILQEPNFLNEESLYYLQSILSSSRSEDIGKYKQDKLWRGLGKICSRNIFDCFKSVKLSKMVKDFHRKGFLQVNSIMMNALFLSVIDSNWKKSNQEFQEILANMIEIVPRNVEYLKVIKKFRKAFYDDFSRIKNNYRKNLTSNLEDKKELDYQITVEDADEEKMEMELKMFQRSQKIVKMIEDSKIRSLSEMEISEFQKYDPVSFQALKLVQIHLYGIMVHVEMLKYLEGAKRSGEGESDTFDKYEGLDSAFSSLHQIPLSLMTIEQKEVLKLLYERVQDELGFQDFEKVGI